MLVPISIIFAQVSWWRFSKIEEKGNLILSHIRKTELWLPTIWSHFFKISFSNDHVEKLFKGKITNVLGDISEISSDVLLGKWLTLFLIEHQEKLQKNYLAKGKWNSMRIKLFSGK